MRHPKANAAAQQCLRKRIERYERDGRPIVYIDESGFAHDMPRTHGYAPKSQRCIGRHDWNAKGRLNVIGALLAGVMLERVQFNRKRKKLPLPSVERVFRYAMNSIELNTL